MRPEVELNATAFTIEEQKKFDEYMGPVLKENQDIPRTITCPIPESVINIDTPPGATAYVPQYPIAERLKADVDACIAKWLQNDVIEYAEKDVAFNSPLTCAPKPNGGVRVCIDPRKINSISQDDNSRYR